MLNVGEKGSCLSLSYLPPRRISKYPDKIKAIHNEYQGRFKSRRLHKPPIPVGLPFFFVKVSLFKQVTLLRSHLLTEKRTVLCLSRAWLKKSCYAGWRQHWHFFNTRTFNTAVINGNAFKICLPQFKCMSFILFPLTE